MKTTLKNTHVSIEYRETEKEIFAQDLDDKNNFPAMYTKSKRGLKAGWEAIQELFTPDVRLFDVINILRDYNIKTHYWCMMD